MSGAINHQKESKKLIRVLYLLRLFLSDRAIVFVAMGKKQEAYFIVGFSVRIGEWPVNKEVSIPLWEKDILKLEKMDAAGRFWVVYYIFRDCSNKSCIRLGILMKTCQRLYHVNFMKLALICW